jgi:membrane-associated phospholipid phosphatase
VHVFSAPLHHYLFQHAGAANALLIISSAFIDLFGIFLLARSIFGPTIRPFLSLLILFALRQVCQGLCALPPPEEMIWRDPGFPSLLVTYGVANDLFFSGHTAIAVVGAIELASLKRRWLAVVGIAVALFEAAVVLTLRAHYTMDVFTGAVTALLVAGISFRLAPVLDGALANRKLG